MTGTVSIPAGVAKDIARWMRDEVAATPSGYRRDWADLLDPPRPTLREQVAVLLLDLPVTIHRANAPEYADTVLTVVADWLAAQPRTLLSAIDLRHAERNQRDHDVRLLRDGGRTT